MPSCPARVFAIALLLCAGHDAVASASVHEVSPLRYQITGVWSLSLQYRAEIQESIEAPDAACPLLGPTQAWVLPIRLALVIVRQLSLPLELSGAERCYLLQSLSC
jgi:hypothetical protein